MTGWLTPPPHTPNIWLRIGAFNLAMAFVVGASFGLAARTWLAAFMDDKAGRRISKMEAAKGAVLLLLGVFYTVVAWPMLIWDHPARLLAAVMSVLPPLVTAVRRSKGRLPSATGIARRTLNVLLILVLLVLAALTLLRVGYITLAGDRVPLVLEITGEVRGEPAATNSPVAGGNFVMAHHVILWLPSGTPAADLWIAGFRVKFSGKALIFSHRLNHLGFPNLYRFRTVLSAAKGTQGYPAELSAPMPHVGPLTINSWWNPLQDFMVTAWPKTSAGDHELLGMRIIENQSPFYPLTGKDGQPLKAHYLLDLTLDGIPTSRGSSPFEKR